MEIYIILMDSIMPWDHSYVLDEGFEDEQEAIKIAEEYVIVNGIKQFNYEVKKIKINKK